MFNISDFRLPTVFLKRACKLRNCAFIDLPVIFDEQDKAPCYKEGALHVGMPEIIGDTLNRVISLYVRNFEVITGCKLFEDSSKEKIDELCVFFAGFFRFLSFSQDSFSKAKSNEPVAKRLGQEHFIWIALKDIIGPAFNIDPIKNVKLIISPSFCVDAALFVDDENFCKGAGTKDLDEPFIFVNNDIEYSPYLHAHVLIEAIKAHGECPDKILEQIMSSTLKEKLEGLAKLEFSSDDEANDFIKFLVTLAGLEDFSEKLIYDLGSKGDSLQKNAQHESHNPYINITDTWWFLGLIEKMLDPARGPDWSTHQRLNPYFEELWNRIEKEREKRGRNGLTYEALLRIKDGERDPNKILVIEKELASNRVW